MKKLGLVLAAALVLFVSCGDKTKKAEINFLFDQEVAVKDEGSKAFNAKSAKERKLVPARSIFDGVPTLFHESSSLVQFSQSISSKITFRNIFVSKKSLCAIRITILTEYIPAYRLLYFP